MKPHIISDLETINSLCKTLQKDIKLAFDFFDKTDWTLKEIINFILKNHKKETTDSRIKAIDNRKFNVGSLMFDFNVIEDWEAPDDTTYYYLELTLSMLNINDEVIKSAVIKNIQSEQIFDTFWGMGKDDFLSFTEKMDEWTNNIFENIDSSKTKNLYNYTHNYYSDFIDKINKK